MFKIKHKGIRLSLFFFLSDTIEKTVMFSEEMHTMGKNGSKKYSQAIESWL